MQGNSVNIKPLQEARDRINLAVRLAKWLGAGSTLGLVALINPLLLIFVLAVFVASRHAVQAKIAAVVFVILFAVVATSMLGGWALNLIATSQNPVSDNWQIYADPDKWQKAFWLVCLYGAILWFIVRALPAAILYREIMQPPSEVQTISYIFKRVAKSFRPVQFCRRNCRRVVKWLTDNFKNGFRIREKIRKGLRSPHAPALILHWILFTACLLPFLPFFFIPLGFLGFGLGIEKSDRLISMADKYFDFLHNSPYWWLFAIIGFVLALLSRNLFFSIRRMRANDVTTVRTLDKRPPIILLRSFSDDLTPVRTSVSERSVKRDPQDFNPIGDAESWTLEQSMERVLLKYGPVIAIGRPGEKLPPLGAAREYVENDKWREKVEEYVETAGYVVFILGSSEGLEFEYSLVGRLDALEKTILVFPPINKKQSTDRWNMFCQAADVDPDAISPETAAKTILLGFRDDNRPYAVTGDRRRIADTYELGLTYWLLWQSKSTGEHRTAQRHPGYKQQGLSGTPEDPRKKRQLPILCATILSLSLAVIPICLYGLWIAADKNDVQLLFNQPSDLLFGAPAPLSFAALAMWLLAMHGLLVGLIYKLLRVPNLLERYPAERGASKWFLGFLSRFDVCHQKKWRLRENLRRMVYRLPFFAGLLLPVVTLFIFWAHTLVMHDWHFTSIHMVAFLFSLPGVFWVLGMRKRVLAADSKPTFPSYPAGAKAHMVAVGLRFLAASLVMVTLSFGAIDGVDIALTSGESPCNASNALYSSSKGGICNVNTKAFSKPHVFTPFQVGVPQILDIIGFRAFADISEAEVSPMMVGKFTAVEEQHAQQKELAGATLTRLNLRFAKADRILLTSTNLRHIDFRGARMVKADLRKADLRGADFRGSVLIGADLRKARLQGADMRFCVAPEADLRSALLQDTRLENAGLISAKLQRAFLERARLESAFLVAAQLQGALLREAQLRDATLYSADLEGSNLVNADLTSAKIANAHLNGADLRKANLTDAELLRTDLEGALLMEANLTDSDLTGANLADADLSGAILKNAKLKKARFCRTIMPDGSLNSGGCSQPFP